MANVEVTKERMAVMQGFIEGKEIECRIRGSNAWVIDEDPIWNWKALEYRIKPTKKLVPLTYENMKHRIGVIITHPMVESKHQIIAVDQFGVTIADKSRLFYLTYQQLLDDYRWEITTDCRIGKME